MVLPTAIVASLLVVHFDWRTNLRHQMLTQRKDDRKAARGGVVFHTGATIEYRERAFNPVVRPEAATDVRLAESEDQRRRLAAERALDNVLADSFPASDPPSWTPGIARPEPARHATDDAAPVLDNDSRAEVVSDGVIDVSRPNSDGRTFVQNLVSLAGAVGIALLVPFAILLVGLPVALAVRGTVEAISWLLALIFG